MGRGRANLSRQKEPNENAEYLRKGLLNGKVSRQPSPPTLIFLALLVTVAVLPAQVTSPDQFIGFKVGADRKLFGWQTVVDYFRLLSVNSERVTLRELGETTLERPFIMALISSPTNLMNLARYKNLQKQAADPGHLTDDDARTLARQNKLVAMLVLNIKSTEIASSQGSLELAYSLATNNDARTNLILENTIILLVPSLNPDGMQLAVDWYNQYLGSPSEAVQLPVVSHHYAGDEIDLDWPMLNLQETQMLAKELYQEWFPQLVYAQYPGTQTGPRLILPEFTNSGKTPLHDAIIDQSNMLADQIASDLRAKGIAGLARSELDVAILNGTVTRSAISHNMIGFMTQFASAPAATPVYLPKGSIKDRGAGAHDRIDGHNSFEVWQSGWWRLRDIIDYQLAVIFSLLEEAATHRESIIYNFCKMNQSAIEAGRTHTPFAYIVPQGQNDMVTSHRMIKALLQNGVEVHAFLRPHMGLTRRIDAGSYMIPLAQSFAPYVRTLFELQDYSDRTGRLRSATVSTLPQLMGVDVVKVEYPIKSAFAKIDSVQTVIPSLQESKKRNYLISHGSNQVFTLVNRLLNRRKKVYWLKEEVSVDAAKLQPGAVLVPTKEIQHKRMVEHLKGLNIEVIQTDQTFQGASAFRLNKFKLGLYRPWTANLDEGWTRYVLDQYDFPVKLLYNANINGGNLADDFDVIVLPDMTPREVINGLGPEARNVYEPEIPEPYRGGINKNGMASLVEFVEQGGVLITLNRTCEFAVDLFGLPVEKVSKRDSRNDLECQWALLEMHMDIHEPIAFGMPAKATALVLDSPTFRPIPWSKRTAIGAFFSDNDAMLGGSCLDSGEMRGLPAVLQIPVGKGSVILIAFKAQHRGQTAGTFKILFNAIQVAAAEELFLDE
ncbi:hypothetical protein MJD09_02585 [bacterium]|nr:hypothetical protein [bacterium]